LFFGRFTPAALAKLVKVKPPPNKDFEDFSPLSIFLIFKFLLLEILALLFELLLEFFLSLKKSISLFFFIKLSFFDDRLLNKFLSVFK